MKTSILKAIKRRFTYKFNFSRYGDYILIVDHDRKSSDIITLDFALRHLNCTDGVPPSETEEGLIMLSFKIILIGRIFEESHDAFRILKYRRDSIRTGIKPKK